MNGSALDSQMTVSPDVGQKRSPVGQQNYFHSVAVTKFDPNGEADGDSPVKIASFTPGKSQEQERVMLSSEKALHRAASGGSPRPSLKRQDRYQLGIRTISSTHYQILMAQCKLQDPKNATYLV